MMLEDAADLSYHQYDVDKLLICTSGSDGCTFGNVHTSVMATQVPGFGGMAHDEGVYDVKIPYLGYIGRIEVWDNGANVSNETLFGHLLYYGYINRAITIQGGNIYLSTTGEGANYNAATALANRIFGPKLWQQQDQMTKDYFNQHFGH